MLPQVVQSSLDAVVASGRVRTLPLFQTAAQVLAMVDRPTCDAWRLSELVRRDPAMTART